MTCVLAGAGYLFAATASTARGTQLRLERPDTQRFYQAESVRLAEREERLQELRRQVTAMQQRAAAADVELRALQSELAARERQAGLSPVTGPAVRITLDDAPRGRPQAPEVRPNDLVVHQQDVQAVVNALWAGGAEAMQLQDQRVISTSAVRCVGNTLILQGRVYSPPYVITAVGDVRGMKSALAASSQIGIYREYVTLVGLGWKQETLHSLTLPGFGGDTALNHATVPTPSDSPSPDR